MTSNDVLTASIKSVRLHKEEREMIGALFGTYESHYIAKLNEYPKGIVVVDSMAARLHPDWKKKTDNRANQLSSELAGRNVILQVIEVFPSGDFEATLC